MKIEEVLKSGISELAKFDENPTFLTSELFKKKPKRAVLITTDTAFDRRILLQGESLVKRGYDVYLIMYPGKDNIGVFAGWKGKIKVILLNKITFPEINNRSWFAKVFFIFWGIGLFPILFITKSLVKLILPQKIVSRFYNFKKRLINKLRREASRSFWKNYYLGGMIDFFNMEKSYRVNGYRLNRLEVSYFNALKRLNPDLVVVNDLPLLGAGALWKKISTSKLVYDAHEIYWLAGTLTKSQSIFLRKKEEILLPIVDEFLTVNPLVVDFFKEIYSRKIHNIENKFGFFNKAVSIGDRNLFRGIFPNIGQRKILLYQGWISSQRNLHSIIEALKFDSMADWVLVIMGYGDHAKELHDFAEKIGVRDRVYFMPAQSPETFIEYSASADLGVIPYVDTHDKLVTLASPNKLYEFGSIGLPMVVSGLPFLKSVIEKYNNGFIANFSDSRLLAEEIDLNCRNGGLEALKQQALLVKDKFGWDSIEDDYLNIVDGSL